MPNTFAATPPPPRFSQGPPVNLIFSYVHPTKSQKSLGPFHTISLQVDGLRTEADEILRAPYRNHQWDVDGLSYFRLDCTARVAIQFARGRERSTLYGPYERFSAVNGLSYGDDRVIAFLDYKVGEWFYYDTGYHWPVLLVADASQN